MNKQKILIAILTILFSILQVCANDEFNDFLSEIKNTIKIATKNKVETIYAPGIITVLKSEDLKRRGVSDFCHRFSNNYKTN